MQQKPVKTLVRLQPKVYVFLKYLAFKQKRDMSDIVNDILAEELPKMLTTEEQQIIEKELLNSEVKG